MGASCCSNPNGDKSSPASRPEEHNDGHEHSGCCGDDYGHQSDHDDHDDHDGHAHGGCCGDDHDQESHNDDHGHAGCCDDSDCASVMSTASTCCGSEERCDGKPYYLKFHRVTSNTSPQKNAFKMQQHSSVQRLVKVIQATTVSPYPPTHPYHGLTQV